MPWSVFETGPDNEPYCVYRVSETDGTKMGDSLGCHPTEGEAKDHIRAIGAAVHARATLWLPIEAIRALCSDCASQLDALGVKRINLLALKQMPTALREGLCGALGADEGFFTRCMAKDFGEFDPTDKEAFCAWLHRECVGKWPGEKATTVGAMLKAASVGGMLESRAHDAFTHIADALYGAGLLNREERIALSSAIGKGLEALSKAIDKLGLDSRVVAPDVLSDMPTMRTIDMDDVVVASGTELKALGGGLVGGYLVVFSPQKKRKDLSGEYFMKSTKYFWEGKEVRPAIYHHGLDPVLKKRFLGTGWQLRRTDDVGLWVETQLDLRDEYEKAIYSLTNQGKLGLSSGTASHLIERNDDGGILTWPIVEGSFTPTPMEPRTQVLSLRAIESVSLKSLLASLEGSPRESDAITETPGSNRGSRLRRKRSDIGSLIEYMKKHIV